jgi:phage terminase large subunit-like protein
MVASPSTCNAISDIFRRQHESHPYHEVRYAEEDHLAFSGAGRTHSSAIYPMALNPTASSSGVVTFLLNPGVPPPSSLTIPR